MASRNWQDIFQRGQGFSPSAIQQLSDLEVDVATSLASVTGGSVAFTGLDLAQPSADIRFFQIPGTPVFDGSFVYSKISSTQDGFLVVHGLNISAGSAAPLTYFKGIGFGNVAHSGAGNLDMFWASVTHSGTAEAGLFIGDLTGTAGGNVYGIHTRVGSNNVAPAILVAYECEVVPNVAHGANHYYNILVQNSGSQPVSAGIQIESPASGGGGKYDKGINFDSTAASVGGTGIFMGGVWGAGIDLNNNSLVGVGSIAGTGASGSRFVRVADFLTLDNTRTIGFKDSGGTRQDTLAVSSSDDVQFIQAKAAGAFLFRDNTNASTLASITSSGRGSFTGGVTSKYTSGAVQPGFTVNGQIEVWHDTGGGLDWLVVNVNGVSKKVQVT